MTSLEEFAGITRRVISKNGFEGFLPTVLVPSKKQIRSLEGVPAEVDIEQVALAWAARLGASESEYLVAFKVSPSQFKVARYCDGAMEQQVYEV